MKKILSAFLALVMIVSVFAVSGGRASAAKALPEGVLYYWGFEDTSDLISVEQMDKQNTTDESIALHEIIPSNRGVTIAYDQGVSGHSLYLDGTYGVKLKDLGKLDQDCYTVSFWMYTKEVTAFAPVVQLGSNMSGAADKGTATWMDFMLPEKNDNGAMVTVWMNNADMGVTSGKPGYLNTMSAGENGLYVPGKWMMVTLVVDGEKFQSSDEKDRIGTKLYLDGKLVVDATAETKDGSAVLPGILSGDAAEGYVGINYNDPCFKGYVDELYIFDKALDAEAVQKMYQSANPTETVVPVEPPKPTTPVITKDPTSEAVTEGGTAYFVARGENYNYINWYIVSADHNTRLSVNSAPWDFPGLAYSGEGTTTLQLSNIPMSLNGWCVEATFTGDGGIATTRHCFISVNKAPKTPLSASPSSGYFVDYDQAIQLNAAPGDSIYYELHTDSNVYTNTIKSGEYAYIPAIAGMRYDVNLYAYVVGDQGNAISCRYTMDCVPAPVPEPTPAPAPSYPGGTFTNNEAILMLTPIGEDTFAANLSVLRLCSMDGTGLYSNGIVWLTLTAPDGSYLAAIYYTDTGNVDINSSTWEYLPQGTTFPNVW